MPRDTVNLHLDSGQLALARRGRFPLVRHMTTGLAGLDIALHLRPDSVVERHLALLRPGWSVFHQQEPAGPRGLTLRRAYLYPFWRIERTNARWSFRVATRTFDPAGIDPDRARAFQARLRRRLCGTVMPQRAGYIHMPLQGRLLECRSFQSQSPISMIETVLAADPRPIRATLHPKETYSASEQAALRSLTDRHSRFHLVGADPAHLAECDLVVTQNSSVAFQGFLLDKPAVLFALADFHHIAASVPRDGLNVALRGLAAPLPDFAAYLWWFLKENCVDAGSNEAPAGLIAHLRAAGWPY